MAWAQVLGDHLTLSRPSQVLVGGRERGEGRGRGGGGRECPSTSLCSWGLRGDLPRVVGPIPSKPTGFPFARRAQVRHQRA